MVSYGNKYPRHNARPHVVEQSGQCARAHRASERRACGRIESCEVTVAMATGCGCHVYKHSFLLTLSLKYRATTILVLSKVFLGNYGDRISVFISRKKYGTGRLASYSDRNNKDTYHINIK